MGRHLRLADKTDIDTAAADAAAGFGARLVHEVRASTYTRFIAVEHADGCVSAVLLSEFPPHLVTAMTEMDMNRIVRSLCREGNDSWWAPDSFLEKLTYRGCAEHEASHWRAQHAAPELLSAA